MTALSRAAGSGHREVVFFLLARGAPGAGGLLVRASRQGDEEMLRAVLENGNFDEDALAAAREDADSEDIAALLREGTARRGGGAPNSPREARRHLAGSYWNETAERGSAGRLRGRDAPRGADSERDSTSGDERFTGSPPSRSRPAAVRGPS